MRVAWLALLLTVLFAPLALGDSYDDRRVRTGARLLRSLLAADLGLEQKAASRDGQITVWIYGADDRLNREIGLLIAPTDPKLAAVRNLPLRAQIITQLPIDNAQQTRAAKAPVSLYLASNPDPAALPALIEWSRKHGVILFSPFEGQVERGVASGLAIGAKVQPLLSRSALAAAGIELKPFFLRVAKVLP